MWRSAALEEQWKELKSQCYWWRKAAQRFVTLFTAESISALSTGTCVRRQIWGTLDEKRETKGQKESLDNKRCSASGRKKTGRTLILFCSNLLMLKVWWKKQLLSLTLIKHGLCYCLCIFTKRAEKHPRCTHHVKQSPALLRNNKPAAEALVIHGKAEISGEKLKFWVDNWLYLKGWRTKYSRG